MRRVDQLEFPAARRGEGMTRLCPNSVDVVYDGVRLTRTRSLLALFRQMIRQPPDDQFPPNGRYVLGLERNQGQHRSIYLDVRPT